MPLAATVNGERIVATLLNDEEWARLRAEVRSGNSVLLMRCGQRGHPKTSTLGTRFFAHNRGGDSCSAGESAHHLAGKSAVMAWVHAKYPDLHVDAEVAVGDRDRVADVMVTWPDGQRVAIEIQYAALSIDSWRERTEDYSRFGIHVVWFFGHTPPHLRPARPWQPQAGLTPWPPLVRLAPLHRHLARTETSVAWIDPGSATLALPTEEALIPGLRAFLLPSSGGSDVAGLLVEQLSECGLDPHTGLVSAGADRLASAKSEYESAEAERLAQEAADEARRVAERIRRRHEAARRAAAITFDTPMGPPPEGAPWSHCRHWSCRLPLDPILRNIGYHFGCEPPVTEAVVKRPSVPPDDGVGALF